MIIELKTNRMVNPMGIDLGERSRLSFVDTQGMGDTRVQGALDWDFEQLMYDSDSEQVNPVAHPLPITLRLRTRYHWQVQSDARSAQAWFETSKLDELWEVKWITPDFDRARHPEFCSSFSLPAKPVSAGPMCVALGCTRCTPAVRRRETSSLRPGSVPMIGSCAIKPMM